MNTTTGQVIRPGAPSAVAPGVTRADVVAFDTMSNPDSASGLNVAYVDPGSYDRSSSSTTAFALGLSERGNYRGLSDFAGGFPLPTDILWNDYLCEAQRWPGGASGPPQALAAFGFVPYFSNIEPPVAARTHTLRVEFFNHGGTVRLGGFEAQFRVTAGQVGYFGAELDLRGFDPPVMAGIRGRVMVDWVEGNNAGVGCMFTGGDLVHPGCPRPSTLWTFGQSDPLTWWFADGATGLGGPPQTVDAGFDGDPGSVSYLDVLNTGALANWRYALGNPATRVLPHDFGCRLTIRGAEPSCRGDVNGSGELNSQDFFDFLGSFFAGEADFDGSGETNSQDFFEFLLCFFGSC